MEQIAVDGASKLFDYGLIGVILTGVLWFCWYMYKSHKEERESMRKEMREDMARLENLHRDERKEWQRSAETVASKLTELAVDINRGK